MSRTSSYLATLLLAGVCAAGFARADGLGQGQFPRYTGAPGGGCGACGDAAYQVCKKPNYKPPTYHSGAPFGYYETCWSRFPSHRPRVAPTMGTEEQLPPPRMTPEVPPLAPPRPAEVEPLPAPRPLESTRAIEGPMLPRLLPAGFPERR